MNTITKGHNGEEIALKYLLSKGHILIMQNFRCLYGEIDLITKYNDDVYFYEVKLRANNNQGYPEESISDSKIRKIKKTIDFWISTNTKHIYSSIYLNAIAITLDTIEILEFEIF